MTRVKAQGDWYKSVPKRASILVTCGVLLVAGVMGFGFSRSVATAPVVTHQVAIENMRYTPAVVTMHRGERVTFKNLDLFPHSATGKEKNRGFDSLAIPAGGSWTYTATQEGTIHYSCMFHPTMEGSIVVVAP
ncbi:MAG: plastocyanin/azurin family copper-binding protein [Opitutaceae bacterium]